MLVHDDHQMLKSKLNDPWGPFLLYKYIYNGDFLNLPLVQIDLLKISINVWTSTAVDIYHYSLTLLHILISIMYQNMINGWLENFNIYI